MVLPPEGSDSRTLQTLVQASSQCLAQLFLNIRGGHFVADTAYFGPELEFFIFDRVCYDQTINAAHYEVDSAEGVWRRGRNDPNNLGNQLRAKEGYFPTPPADQFHNLRSEMTAVLLECGIDVETHHHEVATGGQAEIDMRFGRLVEMGDKVMLYKYILKNVAARHGKVVTFMPKPLFGDNGSGMHTHFSLWKDDSIVLPVTARVAVPLSESIRRAKH